MWAHPLLRSARPQFALAFGLFSHPSFTHHSYTHAYSSLSTSAHASPSTTSVLLREPNPAASREVPTPLVFVSVKQWEAESGQGLSKMSALYAERGYTCLEVDLAPPSPSPPLQSSPTPTPAPTLLPHYAKELRNQIRLLAIPWPPILISRSLGCLVTQAYISDYGAKGLVLLSPPVSVGSVPPEVVERGGGDLGVREFNYEPKFPILVVDTSEGMGKQKEGNRVVRQGAAVGEEGGGGMVELLEAGDLTGQAAIMGVERWMDSIGV